MATSGCFCFSARVAASPFMPGIEMSMTMTSGFSAMAFCIAAWPSLASEIDLHVGLAVDEQLEPVTHRHVIVGQKNAKRGRAFTA